MSASAIVDALADGPTQLGIVLVAVSVLLCIAVIWKYIQAAANVRR